MSVAPTNRVSRRAQHARVGKIVVGAILVAGVAAYWLTCGGRHRSRDSSSGSHAPILTELTHETRFEDSVTEKASTLWIATHGAATSEQGTGQSRRPLRVSFLGLRQGPHPDQGAFDLEGEDGRVTTVQVAGGFVETARYVGCTLRRLAGAEVSVVGSISEPTNSDGALEVEFDLTEIAIVQGLKSGSVVPTQILVGCADPPDRASPTPGSLRVAHAITVVGGRCDGALRCAGSPWRPLSVSAEDPWLTRLPLDQRAPWRICISGEWPQGYDAVVRVWPKSRGERSSDGGWDWSKPIGTFYLKISDGVRHADLTLPPGRFLAALGPVGVRTGMWRAAALATATIRVVPGQVESGETILTVPGRLEVDQASLRIETERAPWNARFSIEGPGAYSHSRVIHHGMCGAGAVLHTTYVRGSGLYLISDPAINFVAALDESELSRGYLRVPLPGRLILEARSEITGLPIEDASFLVEPLHLAEGVRPWSAQGEPRGARRQLHSCTNDNYTSAWRYGGSWGQSPHALCLKGRRP